MTDEKSAYQALVSRDRRFDGLFFTAVRSTGIYCRPVCPARTPLRKNCQFFRYAEQAEKAGYRPCLRCRPELAPGHAPIDKSGVLCHQLIDAVEAGLMEQHFRIATIASQFSLSERQLRRIISQQLGVTPGELRQSRRLRLARQLLSETRLPVTSIAFASGFGSIRQFNAVFLQQYHLSPGTFRKNAPQQSSTGFADTSSVRLFYRPPFDWTALLRFLDKRCIKEVEWVDNGHYLRTIAIGEYSGWIRVGQHPQQSCLEVEFSHSLAPVLPVLLQKLRQLFDLNCQPDLIAAQLATDSRLAPLVKAYPGERVPGCFDSFELAMRAILGQQVTVAAATTLSSRLARRFGQPVTTPFPELSRLSPRPENFSDAVADDIGSLGIVGSRIRAILALAEACRGGLFSEKYTIDHLHLLDSLTSLPGIGPWTAHYIVMRAFSWTDAFPKEDIAIRKALGGVTARRAEELSQPWRPWRSYAVMLLWRSLGTQ
ncbi:AlkA N-terminal domain-containing protein [Tatumella sp. UBA2305]|uniref:AlkA N-terminal domain-containing protein n=1 Tax=Tatumella sp. UBA2305 TaxID=1947647 RepID=UPI0025E4F825|nr:AlkA N-terminal domain-containing protein [Tatumella sp. UBA2305]